VSQGIDYSRPIAKAIARKTFHRRLAISAWTKRPMKAGRQASTRRFKLTQHTQRHEANLLFWPMYGEADERWPLRGAGLHAANNMRWSNLTAFNVTFAQRTAMLYYSQK